MQDFHNFGRLLRAARSASGKTMGDLAEALGVPVTEVSDHERGIGSLLWDSAFIKMAAAHIGCDATPLLTAAGLLVGPTEGRVVADLVWASPEYMDKVLGRARQCDAMEKERDALRARVENAEARIAELEAALGVPASRTEG